MLNKYLRYLPAAIIILSVSVKGVYGQTDEIPKELYKATGIPDSLKENANAVVRYSMDEMTVDGPGKVTIKHHSLVTILNEKGDREAIMEMGYNSKYDNYSGVQMRVYDEGGNLIKKYHKGDMYDGSATSGADLVTDERFLAVKYDIPKYPVTIEEIYEENTTSMLDLGSWLVQNKEESVQDANYQISVDTSAGFRYLNKNIQIRPKRTMINGKVYYEWHVAHLKAIKLEEKAEPWRVLPSIRFASNSFVCFGVPGNFSSWKNFGNWLKTLSAGISSLSPERELEIKKMTDTIKSDKAKAKFLYNYLQRNMRYVSVQLGIGGYKPFAATFVDQKKYGDCKALSNYMSALLKAVNIPSYCAIINAEPNKEPADPSFPFNSFNHEILCIPFKGDTTWLECTSTITPFGKLGPFTENRRALLITEDGGKLVNTPRSRMEDNQFNSEAHITLDADGGATAKVKILSTGEYRDDYINISFLKLDAQKEAFMHILNLKQPSVFDFLPSADKDDINEVDINLEYDKFCDIKSGDKQFYRPHVFDLCAFTVPIEDKRKTDYYFEHPLQKSCTTTIDLPTGYEIETLPANQSLKFTYGNYEVKYTYDAAKNQVTSNAKFNITNQVIPAVKYNELQQYLDAVAKAQNKKLVIRKKA